MHLGLASSPQLQPNMHVFGLNEETRVGGPQRPGENPKPI